MEVLFCRQENRQVGRDNSRQSLNYLIKSFVIQFLKIKLSISLINTSPNLHLHLRPYHLRPNSGLLPSQSSLIANESLNQN
jgi:hypothetical protein